MIRSWLGRGSRRSRWRIVMFITSNPSRVQKTNVRDSSLEKGNLYTREMVVPGVVELVGIEGSTTNWVSQDGNVSMSDVDIIVAQQAVSRERAPNSPAFEVEEPGHNYILRQQNLGSNQD